MPTSDPHRVPARLRARFDDIVARTDAVSAEHLDAEYAELSRRMAAALARRRPSPLERGEARTWAAGIVHAVGWVNFLGDPSQDPHMTLAQLAAATGVGKNSVGAASRTIRDALGLMPLDPEWTRPSRMLDNPMAWIVLVDGIPIDVREAPLEVQEEAFRLGVIPFVPKPELRLVEKFPERAHGRGHVPPLSNDSSPAERVLREAERDIERVLASHPDATIEELNDALEEATERYNRRPQAELGGLSPVAVERLVEADWHGAASAIRLDESVTLAELEPSPTLHDARLVLAMLVERGTVKTTVAGNLPRQFVEEFRGRASESTAEHESLFPEPRVLNEPDLFRLHIARVLLELGGLLRRRKGAFALTKRGTELRADERAGALLAALVRTQFKRLDLEFMGGSEPAPELQRTIGYTLYRFGRAEPEWRTAEKLVGELLLPAVRDVIPPSHYVDMPAILLEMRFLRPLVGFGLAEKRRLPPEGDELFSPFAYRRTALFDRVVRFVEVEEKE
jgi:hypothetical protein